MKPEAATQTIGGKPVRIYAIDGEGPYPIHGAVLSPCGWKISTWTADGRSIEGFHSGKDFDLDLTDWRDKIPWDCLVPEIKYVARNEDGEWCGYRSRPIRYHGGWSDAEAMYDLEAIKMPNGPADYEQAIAKRPE